SNADWLDNQGHSALLRKAGDEFTLLARQFTEAAPNHWQALFFPVATGNEWQQVRMFVKRDRKPLGKRAKGDEDTRFIVEVSLSHMGELQMDGFVRRQDKAVQFDLYIRSLIPLDPAMQQDILEIYNNTGQLTGYKGGLLFQAVKEFP